MSDVKKKIVLWTIVIVLAIIMAVIWYKITMARFAGIKFNAQTLGIPTLDTLLRISMALEIDLEKIIAQARKLAKDK